MSKANHKAHYAAVIKLWGTAPIKLGPVPSENNFAVAHAFAPRGAGKQSLGFAMALRDCGMTRDQMLHAALLFDTAQGKVAPKGTPCLNQFKLPLQCGELSGGMIAGAYTYKLTPKGEARVQRALGLTQAAVAPQAAKPEGEATAKAVKRNAAKVSRKRNAATATVDQPVAVDQPATVDQPVAVS